MNLVIDANSIKHRFDLGRKKAAENEIRPETGRGKCCFIQTEGKAMKDARLAFGRTDGILKIWYDELESPDDLLEATWGNAWRDLSFERTREIGRASYISEATTIQNILNDFGLAPRVYGLFVVEKNNKYFPAQLVEMAVGSFTQMSYTQKSEYHRHLKATLDPYDAEPAHIELFTHYDVIGEQIIDLQGFHFRDRAPQTIKEIVTEVGRYGGGSYQSIPDMGIHAHPRDTEKRIEEMKLDKINFIGESVLDVGSNNGAFLRYVTDRGAKRAWGLDLQGQCEAALLADYWLGYYNHDYLDMNVLNVKQNDLPLDIDTIFFLSMNVHVGLPEWVLEWPKKRIIFEENAKGGHYQTKEWRHKFDAAGWKVVHKGFTTDHNPKQPKPFFIFERKS